MFPLTGPPSWAQVAGFERPTTEWETVTWTTNALTYSTTPPGIHFNLLFTNFRVKKRCCHCFRGLKWRGDKKFVDRSKDLSFFHLPMLINRTNQRTRPVLVNTLLHFWGLGLRSTDVAFLLLTQQPQVWFLVFPKIYFDVAQIYWWRWLKVSGQTIDYVDPNKPFSTS